MRKPTPQDIPHLVIVESPANDLYMMLDGLMTGGSHLARQALEEIREEGKKFEQQATGADFKNAIARGPFRDKEQTERFLTRLESVLKQEPRLLATAEILSKYLREFKAFTGVAASSTTGKTQDGVARKATPAQGEDLVYCLLGLFSLMLTALTPPEASQNLRPVNGEENSAEDRQSDTKRLVKSQRATVLRSRSSLLR